MAARGSRSTVHAVLSTLTLPLLVLLLPFVTGCGATGGQAASDSDSQEPVEIIVFASPTLTEAFNALTEEYCELHLDVCVTNNFVNAETVTTQLREGAPADVFASPDLAHMETVADLTLEPEIFVRNELMIVVESGNPKAIRSLSDLTREDLIVVLGAAGRPIGDYSREILTRQSIDVQPASLEESARSVLTKVELGEADAGIVMVTDVAAGQGKVEGVPIPADQNTVAVYPIAVLKDAAHPRQAQDFLDYVLSPEGQATLERFGFLPAAEQ